MRFVTQGYGQHDAHEALRFILSDINEKLAVEVPTSEVAHLTKPRSSSNAAPVSTSPILVKISESPSACAELKGEAGERTRCVVHDAVSTCVFVRVVDCAAAAAVDDHHDAAPPDSGGHRDGVGDVAFVVCFYFIGLAESRLPEGRRWLIDGPFTGPATAPQSIVSDVFRGTLCSRVRCRECHTESVTYEHFFDLSMTIPK